MMKKKLLFTNLNYGFLAIVIFASIFSLPRISVEAKVSEDKINQITEEFNTAFVNWKFLKPLKELSLGLSQEFIKTSENIVNNLQNIPSANLTSSISQSLKTPFVTFFSDLKSSYETIKQLMVTLIAKSKEKVNTFQEPASRELETKKPGPIQQLKEEIENIVSPKEETPETSTPLAPVIVKQYFPAALTAQQQAAIQSSLISSLAEKSNSILSAKLTALEDYTTKKLKEQELLIDLKIKANENNFTLRMAEPYSNPWTSNPVSNEAIQTTNGNVVLIGLLKAQKGALITNGDLTVGSGSIFNVDYSSGNTTIGGNLAVSGTGTSTIAGNLSISGNLNFAGALMTASATQLSIANELWLSSMTSGSILFTGSNGLVKEDNTNLYWDDLNNSLGIGTSSPTEALSVAGRMYIGGSGTSTIVDALAINGSLDISGSASTTGSFIVSKNIASTGELSNGILLHNPNTSYGSGPYLALTTSYSTTPPYMGINSKIFVEDGRYLHLDVDPTGAEVPATLLRIDSETGQTIPDALKLQGSPWVLGGVSFSATSTFILVKYPGQTTPLMSVYSGGSEVLTIDDSGYLGLGTTSPTAMLSIDTNNTAVGIIVKDAGGGNYDLMQFQDPNGNVTSAFDVFGYPTFGSRTRISGSTILGAVASTSSSIPLDIKAARSQTANLTRWLDANNNILAYIDSSGGIYAASSTINGSSVWNGLSIFNGSVGIGTSSPTEALSVAGRMYIGGSGTSTIENNLRVLGNLQVGSGTALLTSTALQTGDSFTISTADSNNHLTLQNLGRVGISSSTPWGILSVEKNRANADMPIMVVSSEGSTSPYLLVNHLGNVGLGTTTPFGLLSVNAPAGSPSFVVGSSTTQFIIDKNGNVGIGTTTPEALLSVGANTFQVNSSGNLIKINNVTYSWPASQGGANTVLTNDGSGNLSWGAGGGGGLWTDQGTYIYPNNYTSFVITDTGNVGIGTTGPAEKLDIAGNLKLNSNQAKAMRLENASSHPVTCDSSKLGYVYYKTTSPEGVCVCKTTGWSCSGQPPGSPGDKKVFVTRGDWKGDLGGIAGADLKCQQEAKDASLEGTFVAWLSDGNVNAKDHIQCSDDKKYVLPNGTIVADNCSDLLDGNIDNPINVYADGQSADDSSTFLTWTGTYVDGTNRLPQEWVLTQDCLGWTVSGASHGVSGVRTERDNKWTYSHYSYSYYSNPNWYACWTPHRLYCFQL